VLDFGVSKLTETGGAALTNESAVMGSPLYMSPEQMEASRDVDARADVWSLGVVLYQLVAGITPFHAEGIPQVCTRVFTGEPTPLAKFRPDAPAGLEAVLLRCFQRNREQRWQNLAELAAALVPFGSARDVVHAERAAAILGLEAGPSRLTDVLPPEPAIAASASAFTAPDRMRGTLDTVAKQGEASQPSGSRPFVMLGGAVVALVLGVAGAAVFWSARSTPHDPIAAGLSAPPFVEPLPPSQSPSAPSPSASAALPQIASALPSAAVVVTAPKPSAVPLPPRPTATAKTIPLPGKGTILDRD
jgi:serine/threonine-protein kinase